jgi:phosphoglycerate dehydrogenase-like enzyme
VSDPLVWLPFEPDDLGEVPGGLRYEKVRAGLEELPASAAEVEYVVLPYQLGRIGPDLFAPMRRLRVVQTLSAGVEHVRSAIPEGVLLCNGRSIHDTATAELAVTLTLATLRDIPGHVRDHDAGTWDQRWGESVADKRVLIVGYGQIGAAIERRLEPLEAEVVRVARSARDDVHAIEELPALLPGADVVIVVVPGTDETRHLFDAAMLARMKPGALLVNVARGSVVDTDALVEALQERRIRAALDVTDPEPLPEGHPLWTAPGLLLTPHVGGATDAMWPRAHRLVREQLQRYAAGEPLANVMSGDY